MTAPQHAILVEDVEGNILAVTIPRTYTWAQVQDQRDVLEELGYETRGITVDMITLAEAKRRTRGAGQ